MTALYRSGDTIYQRKVKLNVSSLTELHADRRARARTAEGVTSGAAGAEAQRMLLRLVQASLRGDEENFAARALC